MVWVDTWSPVDLDFLVIKREVENKKWGVIALEMNRPLGTCFDRYTKIVRSREPSIVPDEKPRKLSLHEQLGIKTFVHRQAILDDPRIGRSYDVISRAWNHQHIYRESVTLACV